MYGLELSGLSSEHGKGTLGFPDASERLSGSESDFMKSG
jgi:hypothetical protein